MAALQTFRSALNGFNREDVVHYIEFLNNSHASQVGQLNTELQQLRSELLALRNQPKEDITPLLEDLKCARAQCAELEEALQAQKDVQTVLDQEISELKQQLVLAQQQASRPQNEEELEAYRRAERAERLAGERVAQLYAQANGILSEASVQVDNTANQVSDMIDQVAVQLQQLQEAVLASKGTLKDAAASLYAVRPIETEE